MKWKEFKEAVEKAGVQDSDDITSIDIGGGPAAWLRIEITTSRVVTIES